MTDAYPNDQANALGGTLAATKAQGIGPNAGMALINRQLAKTTDSHRRLDDLPQLHVRTCYLLAHNRYSFLKIIEHCRPSIAFELSTNQLKLIDDGIPVGNSVTKPAQSKYKIFGRNRWLNRVRYLRQLQKGPVSLWEPLPMDPPHANQRFSATGPVGEIDQVALKFNSRELLRHPFFASFQCVRQKHCKERRQRRRPSANCCNCIPPHHAVVHAQRTAPENSIKPCHSLIPLWTGRHSAMTTQPDACHA